MQFCFGVDCIVDQNYPYNLNQEPSDLAFTEDGTPIRPEIMDCVNYSW